MATTRSLSNAGAGSQGKRKASSPAPSDASERRVRDEHLRDIKRERTASPDEDFVQRHRDGDAPSPQPDDTEAFANMTESSPTARGRATAAGFSERLSSLDEHADLGQQTSANISAQAIPGDNGQVARSATGDLLADGAVGACLDAIENFPSHDEMYTAAMRKLTRHACASALVSQPGKRGLDIIDGIIGRLSGRDLDSEKQERIADALTKAWAGQQGAELGRTMSSVAAVDSFLQAFVSAVPVIVRGSLPASLAAAVASLGYTNKQNGSPSADRSHSQFTRTEGQAGQASAAVRKAHSESAIPVEESYRAVYGVDSTSSGKVTGAPNVSLARRQEQEPTPVLKADPLQRAPHVDTAQLAADGLRKRKQNFAQRFPRSCDVLYFHIHELSRRYFPDNWPQALRNHDRLRIVSEIVWNALDTEARHAWDSLHARLTEGSSDPLDPSVGGTLILEQNLSNLLVAAYNGSRHSRPNGQSQLSQSLRTTDPAPGLTPSAVPNVGLQLHHVHRSGSGCFEPTFVEFVACPRNSAAVLYTVNAPNAPFSDITAADLRKACASSLACEANSLAVAQLHQNAWTVTFGSRSVAKMAMEKEIVLRGRPMIADHIHPKAPGVFFWDASEVEVSASEVVRRITEAFEGRDCRPEVLRQDTREHNGFSKLYAGQQFIVRFDQKPGLFSFFVPLQTLCSAAPKKAWFKPVNYLMPCLLCKEMHHHGKVCEHAKPIDDGTSG